MHLQRSFALSLLGILLLESDTNAVSVHEHIARSAQEARRSAASSSCSVYKTRFPGVTWDNSAWQVQTTNLDQGHYQSRMAIANGYLGINVAALGPFFETDTPVAGDIINGWPLFSQRQTFATISGFFDSQPTTNGTNFPWLNQYGGESVISGVPHWGGLIVDLGNGEYLDSSVNSSTISHFKSTLDAKAGVTMWEFDWTPVKFGISFRIAYIMFAHKLHVNQGFVQLQITPSKDCIVSVVNVLDGTSAVRTAFFEKGTDGSQIYTAVKPNGIEDIVAYLYAAIHGSAELDLLSLETVSDQHYVGANESSIAQTATASLKAGRTTVVSKFVGGASSDGFQNPQAVAKAASLKALTTGFHRSLISHATEWASVFPDDSVDDYTFPQNGSLPTDRFIIESAITAVLNPYYLLQNTVSENALAFVDNAPIDTNSMSVGGLTSDSYAGLIFWDAEIWMQPGLAASHPQAVKQIAKYRVERYAQAKANAQTAYQSSRNDTTFSKDAAVFSWTSGRFGNCTGTGPCFDYEYHINGDIAQEFANYWVISGDTKFFKHELFPIYNSIAKFYSELLVKNGSDYVLNNMTDPDEYANGGEDREIFSLPWANSICLVSNGGFTMPLIEDTLNNANFLRSLFGVAPDDTWKAQAENIFIDRNADAGIILEYTGMTGSISVKQADVILDTFPLNYQRNYTAKNSLSDLEYYAGRQSLNGPGMTYMIFSVAFSQVAPSGCASYTYQQYSEEPYARAPWFFFSEQLTDDYTTNGGTHPAYPFLTGHGGANQVTLFGYLGLRLTLSFTLQINPDLPPQIPNLKYRTFYWQGWPISAVANQTHTTLTRLAIPYEAANMTYANTSIPVQIGNDKTKSYNLTPLGSLILANRRTAYNTTVPGNIAQCLPVFSPDEYLPGQFPLSAVDGAASTKWEPKLSNVSQSITISLGSQAFQSVTGFHFDFGSIPPANVTVLFHNTSDVRIGAVTALTRKITISNAFRLPEVALIQPYSSNTTSFKLDSPIYSGAYATLQIQGNLADPSTNATGATVAEFAIIGSKGQ